LLVAENGSDNELRPFPIVFDGDLMEASVRPEIANLDNSDNCAMRAVPIASQEYADDR
jgi:hypothetical protein